MTTRLTQPDRSVALPGREVALMGLPSLLLGVVPLVWPGRVANVLDLSDTPTARAVLRLLGLRELVVALLFLGRRTPGWLWGFLGQDAVDLPLATAALATGRLPASHRVRVAYGAYLVMAAVDLQQTRRWNVSGRGRRSGTARRSA
jgi:hypothetical protein